MSDVFILIPWFTHDCIGDPLITVVMQEVAMNLDELHVQPHIVFLVGFSD